MYLSKSSLLRQDFYPAEHPNLSQKVRNNDFKHDTKSIAT